MRKLLLLLFAMACTCVAYGQVITMSLSPSQVLSGTTGNVINISEPNCVSWTAGTPGTPTFKLVGGTGAAITAQSVTSATSCTATVTVTAGSATGYLWIIDPTLIDGGTQTAATSLLTVSARLAASQPFMVNGVSGSITLTQFGGTAYTAGTPGSPTFTLSGCPSASITSQSVTNGTTAVLNINPGTTDCTMSINDPLNGTAVNVSVYTKDTYYVRTDGGDRYSSIATWGEADGKGDAACPTPTGGWMGASANVPANTTIRTTSGFYYTTTAGGVEGTTYPTWGASSVTDGAVTWTKGSAQPTNQHCAFNDVRYLYQDGTYTTGSSFPSWGWLLKGGDTAIIRGSIGAGTTPYRIGSAPLTQPNYCNGGNSSQVGCFGLAGNSYASNIPQFPAGIPSEHTRFLGENYAACTALNSRTPLSGGNDLNFMMDLSNTSYVDVQCLDMSDFAGCSKAIASGSPGGCVVGTDDFANYGLKVYWNSHDVLIQDVNLHGFGYSGVGGPTGPNFNFTDVGIEGNGGSGWNADPGDSTTGFGAVNWTNFIVSWNGCAEEYPIVDPLPYKYCHDDLYAGYGDGFGTPSVNSPTPGWQISEDQGTFSYNTQDGSDTLHAGGPGSTITLTRMLAYGNEGNQLKAGYAQGTIQNSQITGNCAALGIGVKDITIANNVMTITPHNSIYPVGTQVTFEGLTAVPALNGTALTETGNSGGLMTFNYAHADVAANTAETGTMYVPMTGRPANPGDLLGDTCRASDVAVVIQTVPGLVSKFQNNTVYSDNQGGAVEVEFTTPDHGATNMLAWNNNVFLGFPKGGVYPAPITSNGGAIPAVLTNAGASWTNNSYLNTKSTWTCPQPGESNAVCADPKLKDETYYPFGGYSNMSPMVGSPLIGAGVAESGITLDFNGTTRANPPTIGAFEYVPGTLQTITVTPDPASVTVGGTEQMAAACSYSDGSTTPCTITWTDSDSHSSVSTTGLVTAVSVGSDTITATMNTVSGTATVTISAPPFMQGLGIIQGNPF